jgi:hypothetical protein
MPDPNKNPQTDGRPDLDPKAAPGHSYAAPKPSSIPASLQDKLKAAIYPATRGPDRVIDRLAYGEVFTEKRYGDGHPVRIRVTRSGSTQEDTKKAESEESTEVVPPDAHMRGPSGV